MNIDLQQQKTRELFLYIAEKLKDAEGYGAVMLNKAFYFIDNLNYIRIGKPISCFKYIKQDFGPTPNPSQFLPLKNDLILKKELEEKERNYHGHKQKQCLSKRKANISVFDKEELGLIDELLSVLTGYNASDLSDITHNHISWQIANDKEILPFYSFLITKSKADKDDINWAKESILAYEDI